MPSDPSDVSPGVPVVKITVEMSDKERRAIRVAAANMNLSMQKWARQTLIEAAEKADPFATVYGAKT